MSGAEIVIVAAIVVCVWFALIRASVRRGCGCRSSACEIGKAVEEAKKDD